MRVASSRSRCCRSISAVSYSIRRSGTGIFPFNDGQSVPLGDLVQSLRRAPFLVKSFEIAIQILFQFIVEDHADGTTARRFDPFDFRLIEAVQIRIVFCLAWFRKAVIDRLPIWHACPIF